MEYKTISVFLYLLTVLHIDMRYQSQSDLADDGKKGGKKDFY